MTVTLQTIADRVGVTRATVSMALRNDPQISKSRREEILKVAEELGYRPNALVSSLMAHIRQTKPPLQRIGLFYLVSGLDPVPGTPGTQFDLYFHGAVAQAASRGFNLEPLWMQEPGMTEERHGKILWTRKIPGVIIGPNKDSLPLPGLPWEDLSAVMIGHSYPEPRFDRVLVNFYNSTRLAVAHIKEMPRRPVRLILPEKHDRNVNNLWKARYLLERVRYRHFRPPLIIDGPVPAVEWVGKNPGCIVLGTNLVFDWLKGAGLRDPLHFRFLSLNVDNRIELTGVREPAFEVGAEAADLVISRIHLNRKGIPARPHLTLIEPGWQNGRRED